MTSTDTAHGLRALAAVGLAGAALTVVDAAVTGVVTGSTSVSDDLWRYPWSSGAFIAWCVLTAALNALTGLGLLAFVRARVAGDGRAARIGGAALLGGIALLVVCQLAAIAAVDDRTDEGVAGPLSAGYGLATVLLLGGMAALAVATLRDGRWAGARRWAPAACAVALLATLGLAPTTSIWIGVGLFGLTCSALFAALLREERVTAVRLPAGAARAR
jgi:hypothetical protein